MRLSRSLCKVVGDIIANTASHAALESLFFSAGAPGEPPQGSHGTKWKDWLYLTGQDKEVDSLSVLGGVIEEFMDLPPKQGSPEFFEWSEKRERVEAALHDNGFRYYRSGRILPLGHIPADDIPYQETLRISQQPVIPHKVEALLERLVRGLQRAMHPLTHRRKGSQNLTFSNEYDVQDLLHSLLRPWVQDIRPEEFTPSYAGSSTRMDFLLPAHELVLETKIVRDRSHAKKIGDELIIDIEHYRRHSECKNLWCIVYDPNKYITNSQGFKTDLEGERSNKDGKVLVKVYVI
ncbi:transposase [Pantoea agglomerans]|uniref:PD-(D/E)XK nuclease domain-containing protein n=1 Tax=Enterobacter agglomerans TaxID=549 RepID=UPI0010BFE36E|nr:transposase [Pantoea agglomerans]MBD8144113.1 transposase [Pantoea agglomerans]MBD8181999.1 transposase [Pantoea agglomerans]MBD8221311.1 transposase [Pantoea agglomerans]TKK22370.1 transposase [Pantoea agglomerans]TKK37460.1 transposase [Pantoea agglomerans]